MDDLANLAAAKLLESGITTAQAAHAGIRAMPAPRVRALYASAPLAPALHIPYLSPLGKPSGLYRLRILAPVPGFALAKPQRYYQPPHTLPQVYFPAVKGVDWLALLSNPAAPLLITEGELKALSSTLHGVPCLGLGGVWNFKSAKANVGLLAELKAIAWADRDVYIAYDSDAVTKPDVTKAQLALAAALAELGAVVYDAGLPSLGEGQKTGLDDYIVARGVAALRAHLNAAEAVPQVLALHSFNGRFLYVREMSRVLERGTGALYDAATFVNHTAANEYYEVQKYDKTGQVKLERKPLAKAWKEWPRRAEVLRLDYEPGGPLILQPGPRYNTWSGWGCTPVKGDVSPWKALLDFIFSETEPEARIWFERWCAFPLQHPGAKLYTATAVWGTGTGTGKTLIGETLLRVYGRNGSLITQGDLESSFNDWLDAKQFVLGDEVTGNESRRHADQLKGLLTGTTVSVNKKFQPRYELPNRVNFYFTSNHPDAFFLEDDDRRFLVVKAPWKPLPQTFYDAYDAWMRGPGPAALFAHLLALDVSAFHPHAAALPTQARQLMIEDNKSDVGQWVLRLKEDPDSVLPQVNGHAPREFFSTHELLAFYDPQGVKRVTANYLGRELKRAGFEYVCGGHPIKAEQYPQARYYAVLHRAKWAQAPQGQVVAHLRAHDYGRKEKF